MGHEIGQGFKKPLTDKVEAIAKAQKPTTKKMLKSFLGLAGFYSSFIENYARIAAPLTEALGKKFPDKLVWTSNMNDSFDRLKIALSSDPVLKLPDPTRKYYLRCDGSKDGIGGILMQKHEETKFPVCYISRKLSSAEKNYNVSEYELLALIFCVKKLRYYLEGVEFILESDHDPLTFLNKHKADSGRLTRWSITLSEFSFLLEAIPGRENTADFLSRCPPDS